MICIILLAVLTGGIQNVLKHQHKEEEEIVQEEKEMNAHREEEGKAEHNHYKIKN